MPEPLPRLTDAIAPPIALGTAALMHAAMAGADAAALQALIDGAETDAIGRAYDKSIACELAFRRAEGLELLDDTLGETPLIRIRGNPDQPPELRLLALCTPGDLMVNTPLDFITNHLGIRLDLLYVLPDQALPAAIPDHDVAFVATSEPDAATLQRLSHLFPIWPRPILNDPRFIPNLARDTLAASLQGHPGICSPPCVSLDRARLDAHLAAGAPLVALPPRCRGPLLIRPQGSHAGSALRMITTNAELRDYLMFSFAERYFVTAFVDYRGKDGLFRKYRIAFIDGVPHLCHMAISAKWMIHYLNAGMTESADKRAAEAQAIAEFDSVFATRHAAAFAVLNDILGFDFYSIDCSETADGRLLVFEADTAAIIHLMDPPDLFPYKAPQMRRVFAAFEALLRRRAGHHLAVAASDAAAGVSNFAM